MEHVLPPLYSASKNMVLRVLTIFFQYLIEMQESWNDDRGRGQPFPFSYKGRTLNSTAAEHARIESLRRSGDPHLMNASSSKVTDGCPKREIRYEVRAKVRTTCRDTGTFGHNGGPFPFQNGAPILFGYHHVGRMYHTSYKGIEATITMRSYLNY